MGKDMLNAYLNTLRLAKVRDDAMRDGDKAQPLRASCRPDYRGPLGLGPSDAGRVLSAITGTPWPTLPMPSMPDKIRVARIKTPEGEDTGHIMIPDDPQLDYYKRLFGPEGQAYREAVQALGEEDDEEDDAP